MNKAYQFLSMTPVLPSQNIKRDIEWHERYTGFNYNFGDDMYAGLKRDGLFIHLQWHADTQDDPLLGGSVIKLFVDNIQPLYKEFLKRGTITEERLRLNTPWHTNEFSFFDLNKNAIYIVE